MSLFTTVVPVRVAGRAGVVPLVLAGAGVFLLAWSQSLAAGCGLTAVFVANWAAVAVRRAHRRVESILREELDRR